MCVCVCYLRPKSSTDDPIEDMEEGEVIYK